MVKVMLYFNVSDVIVYSFISICISGQAMASFDCNFDHDYCGWHQNQSNALYWYLSSSGTATLSTGPISDHTTGDKGKFIYAEVSYRREGDTGTISSPVQEPGLYCLTFWYNMYGINIGILNLYMILYGGSKTLIFRKDKNLGNNDWRKAVINSHANDTYQIVIESVRGDGDKGDIAIDDISIIPRLCYIDQSTLDCNFEDGLCNWQQDDTDSFDWLRRSGKTWTYGTGPSSDHTTGDGHYVYINSGGQHAGNKALLMSPLQNGGKYCFSFWYYMYGEHVDTLKVGQWYEQGTALEVFEIRGDKGQKWLQNQQVLHSSTYFKIIIEGGVRNEWNRARGDIAIDDIKMLSCEDCDNPTPNNAVANSTNFEYGSVIEIACNAGYNLTGESLLVCQAGGTWSASHPSCKPFNCGNRTILNGKFIAPEGTTFGQIAMHICNIGYTLEGDAIVSCTASGWNSTAATCKIVDCGDRVIPNGKLIATNGTTFRQTASYVCNKGFELKEDTDLTCTATGWNVTVATCTIIECGNPKSECNTGYNLTGQLQMICQADGSWRSRRPTCKPHDAGNDALIAVYVVVPAVVFILVVLFAIGFLRRRLPVCKKMSEDKHTEMDL